MSKRPVAGQTVSKSAQKSPGPQPSPHYELRAHDVHAHLWEAVLRIDAAHSSTVSLSMPVWIAGSYMVREFAKHIQQIEARQGARGKALALTQINKNTWQASCTPGKPVWVRILVHAHDNSVRSAWLDADRGFFNPTSLCLRVHGLDDAPHRITLLPTPATAKWRVITGLEPDAPPKTAAERRGFCAYTAGGYEELADSPFELGLPVEEGGRLWVGEFSARGTPHVFAVAGALPSFDGARLLADTQRICEAAIDFWHSPTGKPARKGSAPMRRYAFMLNAVADGYGGLEHRHSTALIAKRGDLPAQSASGSSTLSAAHLPNGEGYTRLLGLISHEYFHTWNVKRLRPAEFERYAFDAEQYTQLLWFFEGFTSYYDDLLLVRAGLIQPDHYLSLLEKTIQGVLAQPGRKAQSVAQASFDAWVKYYRPDSNSPNANVSYYTKGSLVALCFDLTLRSEGRTTLDAVMRELYKRTGGGPMSEAQFAKTLADLSGRSFAPEIAAWVHGTEELPLKALFGAHGVSLQTQRQANSAGMAASLGLVVSEGHVVQVKAVIQGGVAHAAGFAAGDEWWALETPGAQGSGVQSPASASRKSAAAPMTCAASNTWRIGSLQQLRQMALPGQALAALVVRDQRVLRLPLALPSPAQEADTPRLALLDVAACTRWVGGAGARG